MIPKRYPSYDIYLKGRVNMQTYRIFTEDFCDLPQEYFENPCLKLLYTEFQLDEDLFTNNPDAKHYLATNDFYRALRGGKRAKTSAVPTEIIKEAMESVLQAGEDILYLSFSSALSATAQHAALAAEELSEQYPDRTVIVIDSLCASMGLGLLVHQAVLLHADDIPLKQAAAALEIYKLQICHYFTVDDLNFLHRGGRVSKASAVVGSMLGIKPILHVDGFGKLIPIGKVRGRKAALDHLIIKMEKKMLAERNDIVFISHGDCLSDAQYVASVIKQKFGIQSHLINHVGPTIGAHSGPGTIALFFVGDLRGE